MVRERQGSLLLLHITFQNLSRDNFGEDPLPQEVAEVLPGFVLHHARAITPKNLAISPMIQGRAIDLPQSALQEPFVFDILTGLASLNYL